MSTIPVTNVDGKSVGEIELSEILTVKARNGQPVRDAVVRYLGNQRSGNASTKTKGEVNGSGAKPWRQKGTGNARAGYKRSPVWRGGGVVFGPKPRSFRTSINRKAARLALRTALAEKIEAGSVRVLDQIQVAEPKTRLVTDLLKKLGVTGPAVLVTAGLDRDLVRAARNIPGVEITTAAELNIYQVSRYPAILVARDAFERLQERLAGGAPSKENAA